MNKNIFNTVSFKKQKSSRFDLSHDVKMSGNMGDLMPTLVQETLPGDRFELGCESMVRLAPLVAPVMHRIDFTMHYFFVPNRILWDQWEDWITGNSEVQFPTMDIRATDSTANSRKFMDYMGIPPIESLDPTIEVSALPFAAYQKIYDDWYRDQNLIAEVNVELHSGKQSHADTLKLLTMRKRAWEHDYFTSALPFAQKGSSVEIPLGNVDLIDDWDQSFAGTPRFEPNRSNVSTGGNLVQTGTSGSTQIENANQTGKQAYNPNGTLEVSPTTITDLRRAFRLQEFLEKNARGGSRYIEQILVHFGVRSSDARLQRPEYITGVKSPVVISEVLNTTGTNDDPQGNMAGHGVSVIKNGKKPFYCEEHGYIIGICSIMPKPAYQDLLPKHYLRDDRLDFYWPSFAHIGEQELLVKELYAYADSDAVFGYVPRYSEYKYMPSRVAGEFRDSLDHWHLGRQFGTRPSLNKQFIEMQSSDIDGRIFAVDGSNSDNLYMHIYHQIKASRKMPYFGSPSI